MIRAAYVIFIIILACSVNKAFAIESDIEQPVSVKASVDNASINIGDIVTYTINVNAPKDFEIQLPSFGENLADFTVKDFSSDDGGFFSKTYKQTYILDIYETGTFTIPGAVIRYKTQSDSEWKEAVTEEITVTVQSLLDETGETAVIRGIKGPHSIGNLLYVYLILAAIAVIAIIIAVIMYKKKGKGPETIVTPPPAHETALRALRELMEKDYIKTGKIQEYYVELSNIIRHYLEDRFNLKAPEMTTEEFLVHLKNTVKLNPEQKRLLSNFLSHCDMVKFAKHLPGDEEIDSSYGAANTLVEQTKEIRITGEVIK